MLPITDFLIQYKEVVILIIGSIGGFCAHMILDKVINKLSNRKKIIFALILGVPAGLLTSAIMSWNTWLTVFTWCIYTLIAVFIED